MAQDFSKNNKENICFYINGSYLYTEKVLVEYNDIPIFFLCQNEKSHFLALLTDINKFIYVIVKISHKDIDKLLNSQLTMREAITMHKNYMLVETGDDVISDNVEMHTMDEIDESVLPDAGVMYVDYSAKAVEEAKKAENKRQGIASELKKIAAGGRTVPVKEENTAVSGDPIYGPVKIILTKDGDVVSDFDVVEYADQKLKSAINKNTVTEIKVGTENMMNAFVLRAMENVVKDIEFYQDDKEIVYNDEDGLRNYKDATIRITLTSQLNDKIFEKSFQNMSEKIMHSIEEIQIPEEINKGE